VMSGPFERRFTHSSSNSLGAATPVSVPSNGPCALARPEQKNAAVLKERQRA